MKNKFFLAVLCAAFSLSSPAVFAAYLEGGKPVTKRYGDDSAKPEEKTAPAENTAPAEKKIATAEEKTVPAEEKPDIPAEEKQGVPAEKKSLPENKEPSKPETQSVPEKKAEPAATLSPESSPKQNVSAPISEPQSSPAANVVKEEISPAADFSAGKNPPPSREQPDFAKNDSAKNNLTEAESRHFFGLSGFYAADFSDVEIDLKGASLDYKYRLWDGRCTECGYGNSLLLTARLGGGFGYEEFSNYSYSYGYYWENSVEADAALIFGTVGLEFRHQISQSVSFALGAFVGAEHYSVDYRINEYYNDYYGSSSSRHYSGSDSDFALCYGATATLCIEFSKHFGLELGGEIHQSTVELDNVADGESPAYAIARVGFIFRF